MIDEYELPKNGLVLTDMDEDENGKEATPEPSHTSYVDQKKGSSSADSKIHLCWLSEISRKGNGVRTISI